MRTVYQRICAQIDVIEKSRVTIAILSFSLHRRPLYFSVTIE